MATPIAALANQALQNAQATPERSSSATPSPRLMVNLCERMTHIYGHKFTAWWGESAVNSAGELTDVAQTWMSGLRGISGEQIANGLRACVGSGEVWPPTLPEFRAMCLPEKRDPIHRDYIALPKPPSDPARVLEAMGKMREVLQ